MQTMVTHVEIAQPKPKQGKANDLVSPIRPSLSDFPLSLPLLCTLSLPLKLAVYSARAKTAANKYEDCT